MVTTSQLQGVIQGLLHDQNLTRIKKLLIYASRNIWESQAFKLNAIELSDLIQEIRSLYPTLEHLQTHLRHITQTLNKPAEYMLVANALIHHLRPLYVEKTDVTKVLLKQEYYLQIANALEQDSNRLRIKKLLFCACNGIWENEPTRLESISFISLVERLDEIIPSLDYLQAALGSIVNTLNKKQDYTFVSEKIINLFTPLYLQSTSASDGQSAIADSESTQIKIAPPTPLPPPPSVDLPPSPPPVIQHSRPAPPPEQPVRDRPPAKPTPLDWFDVRIEIMKYTNPLRAKLLIFACLHQRATLDGEAWSVVRSSDLDTLLQNLLQAYPTQQRLESQFKKTANVLPQPDQYLQAASAVLRAVKPFYSRAIASSPPVGDRQSSPPPVLSVAPPPPPARKAPPSIKPPQPVTPVPSPASRIKGLPLAASDDEETCSFFSVAPADADDSHTGPLAPPAPTSSRSASTDQPSLKPSLKPDEKRAIAANSPVQNLQTTGDDDPTSVLPPLFPTPQNTQSTQNQ
jgi:hypothetical protein